MKSSIFLMIFFLFSNVSFSQKNVVVTGTFKNFYPPNYKGQLGIPFSKRNNKSYTETFIKPIFESKDSFYYKFSVNEPAIYTIFFNDIYLLPGDSVHLNYYFEDKNRNLKDTFTSIYSSTGYKGNIGYKNYIKKIIEKANSKIYLLRDKKNIDLIRDSLFSEIEINTRNYENINKVSIDYKKDIKKDLLFEELDSKIKYATHDRTKILHLIKTNLKYFDDSKYNTEAYFIALADITEELYFIYKEPDSVLSRLNKYFNSETNNYASLIFAKILQYKLPSYNNPFSKGIALNVLKTTSDKDLITTANSIINKKQDGNKINKILKIIKVQGYNGIVTTIGKIIENTTSDLKYLDFWASWCMPCLEGIPFSKDLPNKFGFGMIQPVMISIDYDLKKWKSSSDRLGINKANSYCILNKSNFEILDSIMNIAPIPHYILIDKNNEIQLLRAPDAKSITQEFISSFMDKNKQKVSPDANQLPPPPGIH